MPGCVQHYRNLLLPDYLEPQQDLGATDDLTGPSRLDQNRTIPPDPFCAYCLLAQLFPGIPGRGRTHEDPYGA